jgi:hypothetical protein
MKSAAAAMASAAARLGLAASETKHLVELAETSAAKQAEVGQPKLSNAVEAEINQDVKKLVSRIEKEAIAKAKDEAVTQGKILQSAISDAAADAAKAMMNASKSVGNAAGKGAAGGKVAGASTAGKKAAGGKVAGASTAGKAAGGGGKAAAVDCSKANVTLANLRATGKVSCDISFDSETFTCATKFEVECPQQCPVEPVNGDIWFTPNSSVCTAARLVGAIDVHGGKFTVSSISPQSRFYATSANSVESMALNSSAPLNAYTIANLCNSSVATSCHKDAKCELTLGLYMCRCRPGYIGDGRDCKEIDECVVGGDNCNAQASCVEFPGGHRCACPAGYEGNGLKGTECRPRCFGRFADDACGGPLRGKCEKPDSCACKPHLTGQECAGVAPSATCADAGVKAGRVTLYLGGELSKPYPATCELGVDGGIETRVSGFTVVASNTSFLLVRRQDYNSVYGCEGPFKVSGTQTISLGAPFKVVNALLPPSTPAPGFK